MADVWRHPTWSEPVDHSAEPDLEQAYIQPGTGNTEAPCRGCDMAVIRAVSTGEGDRG